jgi:oligopeptide/dipeptide ABC transporter ATP-binding protein
MYGGEIVEEGWASDVCDRPQHPYTQALMSARTPKVLGTEGAVARVRGGGAEVAGPGCKYQPRCELAFAACNQHPALEERSGRMVRCFAASGAQTASVPDEGPVRMAGSRVPTDSGN